MASPRCWRRVRYFDHASLPARVISGTPYTVRLFGASTASHEKELEDLLASLPTDRVVTFDLTNLDMHGTLHPRLQRVLMDMPLVRWIASPEWAGVLSRLSANRARVDVKAGPYCPFEGKATRFARR